MKYETSVELSKEKVCRVNNLLLIESLEEMTDEELLEAGANTHDCIPLFCAGFEDGSCITVDICSGGENYYDNCVFWDAAGNEAAVLDCAYEIDDIEFEFNSNTYIVKLKLI